MRLFTKSCFLKQVANFCRLDTKQTTYVSIRQYMLIINKRQFVQYPYEAPLSCFYSTEKKKHFITLEKKAEAIKDAFEFQREQLKDTEQKIRLKGEEIVRDIRHQKEVTGEKLRVTKQHIIKDILETKAKVKERIEGVVEKENIFTVPNVLCVARIVMSPYLGYVILQSDYNLALGLLVFAGVTDLEAMLYKPINTAACPNFMLIGQAVFKLDGWIARKWKGQSTTMGSFLDPLADKVLIATLFVTLTWQNLIPLPLTLLIVGRDVALVIAAFVIRYMSLPPPRTLSRYFDVTYATAQLAPTFISKVNTAVQLVLVGTTLASPVFGYVDHPALQALFGVTAVSTVVAALSYLVSKDTYKFLKKKS